MPDDIKPNQNKVLTPPIIYVVCILGFPGTLPYFLLMFTELAYMAGTWYLNFLPGSSFVIWISLIGIWKMKKWGGFMYTVTIIVTQIILIKYDVTWSFTSLIIPTIVTTTILVLFQKNDLIEFRITSANLGFLCKVVLRGVQLFTS